MATAFADQTPHDLTHGDFHRFSQQILKSMPRDKQYFQTDVSGDELFDVFLRCLPHNQRQHHTCNCCRSFFRHYGNLVTIGMDNLLYPVFWNIGSASVPQMYRKAVEQLSVRLRAAEIVGPFFSAEKVFGRAEEGGYEHFHATNPSVFKPGALTAYEQMALKKEHFGTVERALVEYPATLVSQALALLNSEVLYRAARVIGPVQFLATLHTNLKGVRKKSRRNNVIWDAIANAPAGFCTPRSGMAGTLLDDLASGMDFDAVKRRFGEKMNPTKYMRPSAAPKVGNVKQANTLFDKLGLEDSMKRAWATINDVDLLWKPSPTSPKRRQSPTAGFFDSVLPAPKAPRSVHGGDMTWLRFARTILPEARSISVKLHSRMSFAAITTEAIKNSPRIFQWDSPLAWYLYVGGSRPVDWGLSAQRPAEVEGITLRPGSELPHQGAGVLLILKGCADKRKGHPGTFPEILRADLHSVRSTIEAYSNKYQLAEPYGQKAAGLVITSQGKFQPIELIVTLRTGDIFSVRIDRWE